MEVVSVDLNQDDGSNHRRPTKEEKKAMIKQRREAEASQQQEKARSRREAKAQRKEQEKREREAAFLDIDVKIWELNSRSHWDMTSEERKEVKSEILRLQNQKRGFLETGQGRKLFIGKFSFTDLEEKLKLNPPLQKLYAGSRKTSFQDEVIATFGRVDKWEWLEEKGSVFVTFENAEDAQRALEMFGDYEKKKAFVSKINKQMEVKRIPPVAFLRPSFYARWPRNYQARLGAQQQEQQDQQQSGSSGL
jgi:hypothetical protein